MRVAVAGLRFGAEFVPIYLHHPTVEQATIVDSDPGVLTTIGGRFQVERRSSDLAEMLRSPDIDAVHLVTPNPLRTSLPLQASLPEDTGECPLHDFVPKAARDRHQSRNRRMPGLPVTPSRPHGPPSMTFDQSIQVSDLHARAPGSARLETAPLGSGH